jgi:predicted NBD/HSP70 family sugar kinase
MHCAQAIRVRLARSLGVEPPERDVGLCVPGIASSDGRSIEVAFNVPGLQRWDLAAMVCESLAIDDCAVERTTDAAAALADWQAATGATGRSLGIVIGTGVGLCVMDGPTPLACTCEGAGHLGQIDVTVGDRRDAPIGSDGGRGGLEAYIGSRAVEAAGGIDRAFAAGSPAVEALARAVRICHAVYRPDAVVLLGGIGIRLRDWRRSSP